MLWTRAPTRPVTTTTIDRKRVVTMSDRGRPVVTSRPKRMVGKLMNHWMYRTYYRTGMLDN